MLAASGTQIQNTYLHHVQFATISRPVYYRSALYHIRFTTRRALCHVLLLPVTPCVTSCVASTGKMMLAASGTQIQNTHLYHVLFTTSQPCITSGLLPVSRPVYY